MGGDTAKIWIITPTSEYVDRFQKSMIEGRLNELSKNELISFSAVNYQPSFTLEKKHGFIFVIPDSGSAVNELNKAVTQLKESHPHFTHYPILVMVKKSPRVFKSADTQFELKIKNIAKKHNAQVCFLSSNSMYRLEEPDVTEKLTAFVEATKKSFDVHLDLLREKLEVQLGILDAPIDETQSKGVTTSEKQQAISATIVIIKAILENFHKHTDERYRESTGGFFNRFGQNDKNKRLTVRTKILLMTFVELLNTLDDECLTRVQKNQLLEPLSQSTVLKLETRPNFGLLDTTSYKELDGLMKQYRLPNQSEFAKQLRKAIKNADSKALHKLIISNENDVFIRLVDRNFLSYALIFTLNMKRPNNRLVEAFLKMGADVNFKDEESSKEIAEIYQKQFSSMGLDNSGDVANELNIDAIPLLCAIIDKNLAAVRLCLEYGADKNFFWALATAMNIGSAEIVKLLLEYGADQNEVHLGKLPDITPQRLVPNISDEIEELLEDTKPLDNPTRKTAKADQNRDELIAAFESVFPEHKQGSDNSSKSALRLISPKLTSP